MNYEYEDEIRVSDLSDAELAKVNQLIFDALKGKVFADVLGVTTSAVSQAKKSGAGPIKEACSLIRKIETQSRFGNRKAVDRAIQAIVDILCTHAGYLAVKPLTRPTNIANFLEGLQKITEQFSLLIKELNTDVSPDSDLGEHISEEEYKHLRETGLALIKAVLSVLVWAEEDMNASK